MKRFAVVLAGCGHKDGSEIHEAVTLLLSIVQHGCEYQCFAPNRPQADVIDHVTGKPMNEERNILVEAARIARGEILPLEQFKAKDFDALFFPGGFGAAKNLCDYAFKGEAMEVKPDVVHAMLEMHEAGKPIGAMCIAPVMLAHLFPDVGIDLYDVCADKEHKIFTTPAYMLNATIKDVYDGAYNLVGTVLECLDGEK